MIWSSLSCLWSLLLLFLGTFISVWGLRGLRSLLLLLFIGILSFLHLLLSVIKLNVTFHSSASREVFILRIQIWAGIQSTKKKMRGALLFLRVIISIYVSWIIFHNFAFQFKIFIFIILTSLILSNSFFDCKCVLIQLISQVPLMLLGRRLWITFLFYSNRVLLSSLALWFLALILVSPSWRILLLLIMALLPLLIVISLHTVFNTNHRIKLINSKWSSIFGWLLLMLLLLLIWLGIWGKTVEVRDRTLLALGFSVHWGGRLWTVGIEISSLIGCIILMLVVVIVRA